MINKHHLSEVYLLFLGSLLYHAVPSHSSLSKHPQFVTKPLNESLSELVPLVPVTQNLQFDDASHRESFRIAFGSCYGLVNFYTDMFRHVNAFQPDLWIWLGDAAYTDDIMGSCKWN